MKKAIALSLVLVFVLAAVALAGDTVKVQKGQILEVNLNQNLVVVMTGKGQVKFYMDDNTNCFSGKAPIQKSALAAKDNVVVDYKVVGDKNMITKITVNNFAKK